MKKRYKRLRWAQRICFGLSIVSCIIPVLFSSIRIAPTLKEPESKIALVGVGAFFGAIMLLIVLRSLVGKFIHKLPYTLVATISIGMLLLFMLFMKTIIDDAIAVLTTGLAGAAGGFVLEMVSMILDSQAEDVKEQYYRRNE